MKTISIIIPAYNCEQFIKKCLDSIYNQSFKDAQIIIVNDASTDKTKDILEYYADIFKNANFEYKLINLKKNQGQAACFNYALPFVDSKYFMWLDSDDFLYEDCFKKKVQYMEVHPDLDLSICNGDIYQYPNYDSILRVLEKKDKQSNYFMDLLLMRDVIWVPGSFFVRTSYLFKRIPKKHIFPSRQGQNIQLQLPLTYRAKYNYIDESLYGVTAHDNSHSRSKLSESLWIKRQKDLITVYKKTLNKMDLNFFERKKFLKINKTTTYNRVFRYCIQHKSYLRAFIYRILIGKRKQI